MAKLIYQYPSDNVVGEAVTITPSTEDAGYPKANLYDNLPSKPFKFTATTGQIVFDFGAAQSLDLVAIIHHNMNPGSDLRIQGHATDSWGAPSLEQSLTVLAYDHDGFSKSVFQDLSAIASRSFRYWRLTLGTAAATPVAIGELWLGRTKRTLSDVDIRYPVDETVERGVIEHRTDYGVVMIHDRGVKIRSFDADAQVLNPTQMNAIRTWWDAARGRALPFLIAYDIEAPDVYGPQLVRWTNISRQDKHTFPNLTDVRLSFTEVSRGLVL